MLGFGYCLINGFLTLLSFLVSVIPKFDRLLHRGWVHLVCKTCILSKCYGIKLVCALWKQKEKKVKVSDQVPTSSGHLTPMDEDNDCEIYKNARTKRVKLLFFFVKYANF